MNDQLFEQLLNALKNYRAQKQGQFQHPGSYPTDPGAHKQYAGQMTDYGQQAARAYKQANEPYEESTTDKIAKWGGLASLAGGLVAGAAGADSKGLAQALGLMAGGGLKYRAGAPGRDYRTRQRQLKNKLAGLAQKRAAAATQYDANIANLAGKQDRYGVERDDYWKNRAAELRRQKFKWQREGSGGDRGHKLTTTDHAYWTLLQDAKQPGSTGYNKKQLGLMARHLESMNAGISGAWNGSTSDFTNPQETKTLVDRVEDARERGGEKGGSLVEAARGRMMERLERKHPEWLREFGSEPSMETVKEAYGKGDLEAGGLWGVGAAPDSTLNERIGAVNQSVTDSARVQDAEVASAYDMVNSPAAEWPSGVKQAFSMLQKDAKEDGASVPQTMKEAVNLVWSLYESGDWDRQELHNALSALGVRSGAARQ